MDKTALEEIRQSLLDITALRARVISENDLVGRLFKSLKNDETPAPTHTDLDEAIAQLEKKVPGFSIWYFPEERVYVLVPNSR